MRLSWSWSGYAAAIDARVELEKHQGDDQCAGMVAGEHNDVCAQPVCLLNRLAEPIFRKEKPVMDIRNLNHAKTTEDFRESVEPDSFVMHYEPLSRRSKEAF